MQTLFDDCFDFAKTDIALGPLDGRYRAQVSALTNYLSEPALNRARLLVEVEWLIFLADNRVLKGVSPFSEDEKRYLRSLITTFGEAEVAELKEIEAETKHDVKAVEYFLQARLRGASEVLGKTSLPNYLAAVHIFCTSEDINNLAYGIGIKAAIQQVWLPQARQLVEQLSQLARQAATVPMLAHTHGQPATPVTLGKEMAVFAFRLRRQLSRIEKTEYLGKINGATGTWAAHKVAVPGANWPQLAKSFVEHLGLAWNPLTTQIESHDWQSELYSDLARTNRILHNLATDCWSYISMGYFHQNLAAQGSTGSSTMPHKVNPIRFENAEANLEISCALLETLAQTLVTSRLQRDLTDSSTQRNIGVAIGHSLLALSNLQGGLRGLDVAKQVMARDLDQNWEVLGEAVQQVMRVEGLAGTPGMDNPYERLKELTRDSHVDEAAMKDFLLSLGLSEEAESRLLALTPQTYFGYAEKLATGEALKN
ncbi:adenylosuccinate lyase [uncultured Varibaculum sp.]|uniref:adenylosuccinate lyase n=1 Tax=uncultured Varibaculum sp. TaxID=413896 RepID=UPI00288C615D|nr:adenylosuccinate lyase [uncultured Varibaculum sp.]